jgi:hypothetical protein
MEEQRDDTSLIVECKQDTHAIGRGAVLSWLVIMHIH